MKHPFENRYSILWLGALVAGLLVYFLLAVPNGPVPVVKSQALVAASLDPSGSPQGPTPKTPNPVPLEGMMVAVTIGVIALVLSVSPFVEAVSRRRTVQWVGPRGRAS